VHLDVGFCAGLNGQLPANWSMPALQYLNISGTSIAGGLARVVDGSPALQELLAAGCPQLSEALSEAWRFDLLPSFQRLEMQDNPGVTGTLPNSARRAHPGRAGSGCAGWLAWRRHD
jgi:hypothetical protein